MRTRRAPGRTQQPQVLAVGLLAMLTLVGCGAGSGGADSEGASRSAARAVQPTAAKQASAFAGAAATGPTVVAGQPRLMRTATVELQTRDVPAAAARVRALVTAARGFLADERTDTGREVSGGDTEGDPEEPTARSRSVLTLRVPTASLDDVLTQVGQVGTVLHRSQTSQDVNAQYVDTASRVRSQTASVVRVRALLSRASRIGDVVQIEGELARRQADLEALHAQLASLQDRTALSTLTVTVSSAPAARHRANGGGFLSGLHAGWSALRGSGRGLLTALGALLPFAVVATLVALPVARWRRQRRTTVQPAVQAAVYPPAPTAS